MTEEDTDEYGALNYCYCYQCQRKRARGSMTTEPLKFVEELRAGKYDNWNVQEIKELFGPNNSYFEGGNTHKPIIEWSRENKRLNALHFTINEFYTGTLYKDLEKTDFLDGNTDQCNAWCDIPTNDHIQDELQYIFINGMRFSVEYDPE